MLHFASERQGLPIGVSVNEASNLRNSVLWNPPHLALLHFNCGHHFSALRSSSQGISTLFKSAHNFSIALFFHLFAPHLASSHLFWTLLNNSQLCPRAPNSSHLCSTRLNCELFNFSTPFPIPQSLWLVQLASFLLPGSSSQHFVFSHLLFTVFQLSGTPLTSSNSKLLSSFSTSGTWQLGSMIFWATSLIQKHANWT